MRGPPSIAYSWGRTRCECWVCFALLALTAVQAFGLWISGAHQPVGWMVICIATLLVGINVFVWYRRPSGKLTWDGKAWLWQCGQAQCEVEGLHWVLDFQRSVLLQLQLSSGKQVWVWMESSHMDGPWVAVRRALVFSTRQARASALAHEPGRS